jgi:hypothetical protein
MHTAQELLRPLVDTRLYDTAEGIANYLTDLDGLHRLLADRNRATYGQGKNPCDLHGFLVLGRFHLDRCGNCMPSTFEAYDFDEKKSYDVAWLPRALAPVVSMEDFWRLLPGNATKVEDERCFRGSKLTMRSFGGGHIPTSQHRCAECDEGWTLENCHDAVLYDQGAANTYRHTRCDKFARERDTADWHRAAATEAGLGAMVFSTTPNEYEGDHGEPWCLLRTPKGDLKFGWRKRVVHLDWSDPFQRFHERDENYSGPRDGQFMPTAKNLFSEDCKNVTHGEATIHAWGREKLVEYLTVLAKEFGLGEHKKKGGA